MYYVQRAPKIGNFCPNWLDLSTKFKKFPGSLDGQNRIFNMK